MKKTGNLFEEISAIVHGGSIEGLTEAQQTALKQAVAIAEAQRVRTPAELAAIRYKESRKEDTRRFVMVNGNEGERYSHVTLNQLGVFFKLSLYLQINAGGLLMHDTGRGKYGIRPLTTKDMQKLLKRGKKSTLKALEELEKIGAVIRDNSQRPTLYYINEDLVRCGRTGGAFDNFTKVYKEEAKQLLSKLSDRQAGAIFKLMPYAHKDTYVLCANPQEFEPSNVEILSSRDIAKILGIASNSTRNLLSMLINEGAMISVSGAKTGVKGRGYVISPYVCDRGVLNNPYEVGITKLFDQITNKLEKDSLRCA
ncbi:hypothetical protein CN938_10100 [Bacillus thuringiensis]|nr:hypothetical protein CN283_00155 [Bacillus thuringiensis]PGL83773.1 hypothetical protein CN944_03095 [Bacillus thuringiensis]PGM15961.1 hypothetical protein CN938_10100 [Bacillus thuringiensis]PGT93476.1 hypothetical protein COD17_01720 [Bacillus thuringiensis]